MGVSAGPELLNQYHRFLHWIVGENRYRVTPFKYLPGNRPAPSAIIFAVAQLVLIHAEVALKHRFPVQ